MQDIYTGQAGTFITNPATGERVPLAVYEEEQLDKKTSSAKTINQASSVSVAATNSTEAGNVSNA
jgi:hypothetical protein